jgi:hypothetical protein
MGKDNEFGLPGQSTSTAAGIAGWFDQQDTMTELKKHVR